MPDTGAPGPLTILVVDDEEAIRRNFKAHLEDLGHHVLTAADGRLALDMCARATPDVVLTDLRMPGMDGRVLVAALRQQAPETPVVVVSGTGDIREAVGAIREGAWDYVLKPIDYGAELDITINRCVERARLLTATSRYQSDLEALVTERTAELRERENRLAIVADNTYDWEWWIAPDGRFLYCSPSCERITGWTREEFVDNPGLFIELIHADDRSRVEHHLSRQQTADLGHFEFRIVHRDGTLRWGDLICQPIVGGDGALLGHRGSIRDHTDRKNMESQLLRMQRQESLGRLASGIAHDLNNVLAPVMMAGDLLQTAPLNENGRECVEMIRASAARGADMVKQLLLYGRGADGRRSSVEPARVVREVVRMVKETFPKDIEVRLALSEAPWLIEADRTQIHQVVLNLCVNARDAMAGGGVLTLATECVEVDAAASAQYPQAKPGRYVVLTVSDTGTGIPHEIVDKIFDPFFTTKPQGHGTGLGLSTVQGIVASHGGFVDVQTEPGRGSTFLVYLPSTGTAGDAIDDDPGGIQGSPRGSGQTILVVDDEAMVRNLVQRALEGAGYHVVTADGGEKALAIYGRLGPRIGLVLMDLWMPHVNGFTAIQRLARMDRQVRVIAISGLAEARDEALRLGPVVRHFLVKPWRTTELLRLVSEVLASRQEG